MKATINASILQKLKPQQKPYDVRDDRLTGFFIRVNISGKMLYMCEYGRGKRVSIGKVGVLSPAQARDRALAILADAAKGLDPKETAKRKKGLTVKEFITEHYLPWFLEHRKSGQKTIAHIHRCFIVPFGSKNLDELTPVLIDQWRTRRLKAGKSIKTVNIDIATFKAALSKAVLWGLVDDHPLAKLKLLKLDNHAKIRFLSVEEESRLREAAIEREMRIKEERRRYNEWRRERHYDLYPDLDNLIFADHIRPMLLLSMNTGIRRGELFNLKWDNVNFEISTLTIEGFKAKSGKTRHIPLNSEAKKVLRDWKAQSSSNVLVFPSQNGSPFDTIKTAWGNLLNEAKIYDFRWHDLRHHFASKLVMAGVDLNTVRELLGHSDIAMTLRYAHLAPEHKATAVEKLVTPNFKIAI